MSAVEAFETERHRLFAIAYRMLGRVGEAEDVVQDVWLRFDAQATPVDNPAAWLTTVTTRLAIDRLRSARISREEYVGPWLPEPVATDDDPADLAVLSESLSLAFLVTLERLDPVERAAFLLREVFALPYADVAATIDRTEEHCRQIVHRAKERVDPDRPVRYEPSPDEEQRLLDGFFTAVLSGDVDALAAVLAEDVVAYSDGGPGRRAARHPIVGCDRVVIYVSNLSKRFTEADGELGIEPVRLNGQPGVLVSLDGGLEMAVVFEIVAGGIGALRQILNPDKLGHLR